MMSRISGACESIRSSFRHLLLSVSVRVSLSLSLSEWLLRRQVPHSLLPPSPPASHCGTTFRSRTVSNCRFSLLTSLCSYPNELPAAAAEEGGREGEIGQSIRECTHSGARGGAAGDKSASLTDGGFLRRHRKGRKDRRKATPPTRIVCYFGRITRWSWREGGWPNWPWPPSLNFWPLVPSLSSLSLKSACLSAGGFLSISDVSHHSHPIPPSLPPQ